MTNYRGHRVVHYFEFTERELDQIGEKRSEAVRRFAIAAFLFGSSLDTARDLVFSSPTDHLQIGLWAAVGVLGFLAALYFSFEGWISHKSAKTCLQDIKDEHDFS